MYGLTNAITIAVLVMKKIAANHKLLDTHIETNSVTTNVSIV